jgi:DNA polymerase-1
MKAADREVSREIITTLLTKAKAGTVKSIYGRLAPGPDGKIRSVMSPAGTDTGRVAHSETFLERSTNLANLPNKVAALDPLYNVRDVICAEPGRMLGEADYSQAEARVAAYMARDPLAIWQYENEVDRYKALACELYSKPESAIVKSERQVGKMGQLAFQYGVGWETFMEQVNADADVTGVVIDAKTAKRAEQAFRSMHPRYPAWWDEVLAEVLSRGYLTNPFGRRRDFLAPARNRSQKNALRRAAVAFLPQSTIADLLDSKIIEICKHHDPKSVRFLLQVHDAILFDCDPREYMRAARLVKSVLEDHELVIHGRKLRIPCEVEMSMTSWARKRKVA